MVHATLPPAPAEDMVLFIGIFPMQAQQQTTSCFERIKERELEICWWSSKDQVSFETWIGDGFVPLQHEDGECRKSDGDLGWLDVPIESALTIWKGEAADLVRLPDDRDAGLIVEKDILHLVLRKRTHRQEGSHLKCSCRCDSEKFCVKCDFVKIYGDARPGQQLWDFNSGQFLRQLKEQLRFLGVVEFNELIWKSFRAGKATEMANDGFGLGQIPLAGEWSSVSFLRYLDVEKVNPCRLICSAIDESDGEGE